MSLDISVRRPVSEKFLRRNRLEEKILLTNKKPLIYATRTPKDIGYERPSRHLISVVKYFRMKQKWDATTHSTNRSCTWKWYISGSQPISSANNSKRPPRLFGGNESQQAAIFAFWQSLWWFNSSSFNPLVVRCKMSKPYLPTNTEELVECMTIEDAELEGGKQNQRTQRQTTMGGSRGCGHSRCHYS